MEPWLHRRQVDRPDHAINSRRISGGKNKNVASSHSRCSRQQVRLRDMAEAPSPRVSLDHIARESPDIGRLAKFYEEIFGFKVVENPDFGELKVIWLSLGSSLTLHLIERDPKSMLPESPWSATSSVADPSHLPRGHHICFSVSDLDSFVQNLKEKGIHCFEKRLPEGKVKQAFFFDPDGNGLEISSQQL